MPVRVRIVLTHGRTTPSPCWQFSVNEREQWRSFGDANPTSESLHYCRTMQGHTGLFINSSSKTSLFNMPKREKKKTYETMKSETSENKEKHNASCLQTGGANEEERFQKWAWNDHVSPWQASELYGLSVELTFSHLVDTELQQKQLATSSTTADPVKISRFEW